MMDCPDSQDTHETENFENLDNLQVMQVNFNNPILYQSANTDYKSTNKSNHLSYLFSYKNFEGFALIDTGASQTFINTDFFKQCNIPIRPYHQSSVTLADGTERPIEGQTAPFSIKFNDYQTTVYGPIIKLNTYSIVLGINWLQLNCPYIDWDSCTLIIERDLINYKMYPSSADKLLRDNIFV